MFKKNVSIIIPVKNEKKNIINTIHSIKKNSRFNFKILICYDSVSDNTLRFLNISYTRITTINQLPPALQFLNLSGNSLLTTLHDNNNLSDNHHSQSFPCLVKDFYQIKSYFESFAIDKKQYDFFIQQKNNNKIFIQEIEAYPITIDLVKQNKSEVINYIQSYINSAIDKFDNIHKRICVNRDDNNSLMIYMS
jgi:glycosyltransferase involved in cell wall biosynthesis